ncbi:hypothetical protein CIPAW_07G195500 [Carya illinoinensis]|uniref:ATP-dependent DNA helicase n=1 Tax=Carya illinoinensis TaxID=32201 RepID=A0A8T1Q4J5_CARIL|nr:hypothetical protein CIPAW_07G195500 [Carya illinoinensis]
MYIKIETSRLDYFRSKQHEIRSDVYQGIVDSLSVGETCASNIGKRIILPSSFIGGPRDMRKRYMEAMTLVQRFGKPDIFLTMTCNPNWEEILEQLNPHEEVQNCPDLIARIFRAKLEELKIDLFKREIFGKVAAYVYTIEYQKRGLPHVHFLIILQKDWRIYAPETFDEIVSAEIPNKTRNLHLYKVVLRHMMHGPCGILNPANICMDKDGICKNRYPKEFTANTTVETDCFPSYKRSNNGVIARIRGKDLDNRWVVPYNPYLVSKYNCHINVEICCTVKAVKSLYKYIYKGHDRVAFNIISKENNQQIDEIEQFQSGRWITPPEAMWRIYGFRLNEMYPSVYSLHLYLEDQHLVSFRAHEDLNNNLDSEEKKKTVIGRIVTANPFEGERYYLQMLLNHIRGATSFEKLRTVNGVVLPMYREAATSHGLLNKDSSLEDCLEEACLYQIPSSLRHIFSTILVYCNPTNPKELWERFEKEMSTDFLIRNVSSTIVRKMVLQNIASTLESMGKDINMYRFVPADIFYGQDEFTNREIDDERVVTIPTEDLLASQVLNSEQKNAYDLILHTLVSNKAGAFFVDGPASTGKTFLYRALLAEIRSKNMIELAIASSGVAASILPGGRTAHSRFKIPLNADKSSICNVSKQENLAKLLRLAKLIIWDEAPMSTKHSIEALDKMLQDINDTDLPFGGKVIVFGGDFRQVLPVIRNSTKEQQIDSSLDSSYLWSILKKIKLTKNMRARLDPDFSHYLIEVVNGNAPITIDENIEIPKEMTILYTNDLDSLNSLLDAVFGNISNYPDNLIEMSNRAVLTPKNRAAQNDKLLEEIIGNSFGSASSSSTDPIIKVSEITEKLISAPAMARSTYLVRGKFRMVDFHQSFHYVSCENCNKATGYDLGENFICYSCKNAAIARARCRVYLDVYDDTTSTPVVIFGSLAEEILGCTAVDLIDRTYEGTHV